MDKAGFKTLSKKYGLIQQPLIWARGGLLGALTTTFYDRVLNFLEMPGSEITAVDAPDSSSLDS